MKLSTAREKNFGDFDEAFYAHKINLQFVKLIAFLKESSLAQNDFFRQIRVHISVALVRFVSTAEVEVARVSDRQQFVIRTTHRQQHFRTAEHFITLFAS